MPHGCYKRIGEVDAHLPIKTFLFSLPRCIGKPRMSGLCEFQRPPVAGRITGNTTHTIEGVHPLSQVMEILAVSVPLQTLVKKFGRSPLSHPFADPESAFCGMSLAFLLAEAAY